MTDDTGGFMAPPYQRPTPTAVKAAGARLYQYAVEHQVPHDIAIVDMPIADEVEQADELRKAQRLLRWFVSLG